MIDALYGMANTIIGSQLGATTRARILADQRAVMQQMAAQNAAYNFASTNADMRNQFSDAWQGVHSMAVYDARTAQYLTPPPDADSLSTLAAVPDKVDQAQAFVARQLVSQAQSDYRAALARGQAAEAEAARVRMETAVALEEAAAQRARADRAEAQLRALRPQIIRRLIPSSGPGSHELRWPWLAASWALLAAGVVVCVL